MNLMHKIRRSFTSYASPVAGATAVILGMVSAVPFAQAQNLTLPGYYGNYPPVPASGQWQSTQAYYNSGRLTYAVDSEKNRIPDFSFAGYHYGEKALPNVAVVTTLGPATGDNTSRIQAALDAIGNRTPDANGHRGALLLLPGTYDINGTLRVNKSGIVLRGSSDGTNPATSTILYARGNTPNQRTVVILGSNSSGPWTTTTAVNITDDFVQTGAMSFNVANASQFAAGQEVVIRHPSSQAWIDALDGGGVVNSPPWTAGSMDLRWVRRITKVEGTRLHLDAPIYNHLNRSLTQSTVARVTARNMVTESGVENLRVDIETAGGEDEAHAWNAIGVVGADNCWVQNISARYFGYAGVRTSGAIRVTIRNARATNPVAIRTGGRMYNFASDGFSQLVLVTSCHAAQGRHSFVSNGTTTVSGVVYHRCTMEGGDFEAHRRWSQGLLLDNLRELGSTTSQAKLINRGDFGSSHGWGAAHSAIWGFNKQIVVQKPPTGQNYAVSSEGSRRSSAWYPGPWGSIEIKTGTLIPQSLYEAQLCDRLGQRPFVLVPRHSGKALAVEGAGTENGANVVQAAAAADANDDWFLVGIGGGYCRITAGRSGKVMAVQGASTAENANVVQWSAGTASTTNDQWKIELVEGGYYRIVNRNSGKVIAVADASIADGAAVRQVTWTGATNQQFSMQDAPNGAEPPPVEEPLKWEAEALNPVASGATTRLDADAGTSLGTWLALLSTGAGQYVQFTLPNVPAGTYRLKMKYKQHVNRGILTLAVNGTLLGNPLDQYNSATAFPEVSFGIVTLPTTGNHVVRLTCTGKHLSSGAFTLSADTFTLEPVSLPSISAIEDRSIPINGSTGAIDFTVGADETPVASLTLAAASNNTSLVPLSGIVFGGSGAERNVRVTPAANKIGQVTITVTVSDPATPGLTASTTFDMAVTATAGQSWRLQHFDKTDATGDAADGADPDLDGVPNLMEFALNGNPNAADRGIQPVCAREGDHLVLRYKRRIDATDEVSFTVLASTGPAGPWNSSGVIEEVLSVNGVVETVEARVSISGAQQKFLRLNISR
jgi:hypothetical protein